MSMILDISLDCLTGDLVSYRPDKVSIFPELSSPQLSLYLGEPSEDLLRADAFSTLTISPTEYLGGMLVNMCT